MNFSSKSIEDMLIDNSNYTIEDVKTIGVFEPKRWVETFGKPLTKNIVEAKIIHTITGLTIPLKRYSINKEYQTIEFAGLYGYNEKSLLLKDELIEVLPLLIKCKIKRIDVSYDFQKIPNKIIKNLCLSGRVPFKFKNTTYYKTDKESKTNNTIDIKTYNKQIKEKLDKPMQRLEFCFKGAYFQDMTLEDTAKIFKKMEKSINKFSGIKSKIIPISYI